MKFLVVGGAGYIGSHCVQRLIEDGHEVVVFDNLSTGHIKAVDSNAKFYKGDIRDETALDTVFNENEIECVFHFAALSLVGESVKKPTLYFDNNVYGTKVLLSAMKRHNIKKIVFSSSAAVYGKPDKFPITEDFKLNPINTYGETKKQMEEMMAKADKSWKLKYVALRYFNVVGASSKGNIGEDHRPETHLLPNVIKCVINPNEKLIINGDDFDTKDGSCVRDYIDIEDLIEAHILAYKYLDENKSNYFNLGSENGFSNLEIVKTVEKVTKNHIKYTIGPRREGDPDTLIASSEKAAKLLHWKRKHPELDYSIENAYKFAVTHKNGMEG